MENYIAQKGQKVIKFQVEDLPTKASFTDEVKKLVIEKNIPEQQNMKKN